MNPSTALSPTARAAREWLDATLHPSYADQALDRIITAAETAVPAFVRDFAVTVPLAPGNGWTYDMRLSWLRADDENRWGGNLLVALPAQRVCMAVHLPVLLFPSYVAEKLSSPGFSRIDASVVAAFISLFSDNVAEYLQ